MTVLEHMLKFVAGKDQNKVYYEMALQYECQQRDFKSANECYLKAIP